ncbi:ribosomal RNA small subunit methyltransferase E [Novimethylophilus kurashikiensis]|uniref:Ribosomal RNA small subunit methyltransferase E n=1 Tax=Novimethylophilus kurashikiensis TaxID=1825523 RepID=A0A2R5F7I2_9PROT|nr:ribosomal RNA small subunit methyltransferase E [Novimethylophilus kurashikiensis]
MKLNTPPGGVAGKRRSRTAADDFEAIKIVIGPNEGIRSAEIDVAEIQHGQPVFLILHEFGPTAQRQTAGGRIGIAFATGRLHQ